MIRTYKDGMTVDAETFQIAQWLRAQRRAQDKSQADIAEAMRCDRTLIAKIETGTRDISVSDLRRYVAALGLVLQLGAGEVRPPRDTP